MVNVNRAAVFVLMMSTGLCGGTASILRPSDPLTPPLLTPPPKPSGFEAAANGPEWTALKSQIAIGQPLVEGRIGDATGWFVLDTGAPETCFDERWAREHHLDITAEPETNTEKARKGRVAQATVVVGSITLNVANVPCYDMQYHAGRPGPAVAGFLGYEFLVKHAVRIRYRDGAIDVAAVERPMIPEGSFTIPVALAHRPFVTVLVSQGAMPPFGVPAVIDTGLFGNLKLSGACATRLRLAIKEGSDVPMWSVQGRRRLKEAGDIRLDFGPIKVDALNALVDEAEKSTERSHEALIGSGVLSRFVVVIDYPHSVVVLAPQENTVEPGEKPKDAAR